MYTLGSRADVQTPSEYGDHSINHSTGQVLFDCVDLCCVLLFVVHSDPPAPFLDDSFPGTEGEDYIPRRGDLKSS